MAACAPGQVKLFDDIEPSDVMQGALGDCWLLAATAAVAEFPEFVREKLFVTKRANPAGRYALRLFDGASKRWEEVAIDDRIPCYPPKWSFFGGTPQPMFAQVA